MINTGNTNFIGNTTELDVLAYISRLHYYISIPFGGNARYDQIWDINGKLYKVQIKTSNISDDGSVISFNTGKYDASEIDGFATFFNGKCYYIPYEKTSTKEVKLRFNLPENSNPKNIKFAFDYEVERILQL
jgi:hypothetical protein